MTGSPRGQAWLRALLGMPVIIAALGIVAGRHGHLAAPSDTLFGGDAPWQLAVVTALAFGGIALFAASALIVYAAFVTAGWAGVSGARRLPVMALALAGSLGARRPPCLRARPSITLALHPGLEPVPWRTAMTSRDRGRV